MSELVISQAFAFSVLCDPQSKPFKNPAYCAQFHLCFLDFVCVYTIPLWSYIHISCLHSRQRNALRFDSKNFHIKLTTFKNCFRERSKSELWHECYFCMYVFSLRIWNFGFIWKVKKALSCLPYLYHTVKYFHCTISNICSFKQTNPNQTHTLFT